MNNRYPLFAVLMLMALVFASAAYAAPGTVKRTLPASPASGTTITVYLNLTFGDSNFTFFVNDANRSLLPNWSVTSGDTTNFTPLITDPNWAIRWLSFGRPDRLVWYNISIPVGVVDAYTFAGTYKMEGMADYVPIEGDSVLNVVAGPDFNIYISPSTRTVQQGLWNTTTITLTSLGGWNKVVNLSYVAPANVSVTFSQFTGTPSYTSTANVTVGPNAPTGVSTVNITGTGIAESGQVVTRTTSFTLNVTPEDFGVSVSPNSRSVVRGASTNTTVTVSALQAYSKIVNLSVSGLPVNVTANFIPNSSTPAFSSTMNIATTATAPNGTYPLTITARSADGTQRNKTFSLTISVPVVCGNGIIEAGEECDATNLNNKQCTDFGYTGGTLSCTEDCEFDKSDCRRGGGGGGGGTGTVVTADIGLDSANMSVTNSPANIAIFWSNSNMTALKIMQVNLTPKIYIANAAITVRKITLPAAITPLTNAYQYFNFTVTGVTLPDANITALKIKFAVENSWITSNGITENTVALNRWTGMSWTKLTTTWLMKDTTYTYYEAASPGFSYFGVSGEKLAVQCPTCPETVETPCIAGADGKGRKNVTSYTCTAATNYTCKPQTVTQDCCPDCPDVGNWSACVNAKQSRTAYRCSEATGYKCEQYSDEQSCVDAASANSAILNAQSAIESARAAGKNVTSAEALLTQARTALTAGNYENARNLAVQAQNAAVTAPQLPAAPLLEIVIAIVVIIVAGVGITLLLKRRKAVAVPTMNVCVVCGEATTLQTRCSSCGQYACIKHLQTIAGRPYCSNCVRRMYGQNV